MTDKDQIQVDNLQRVPSDDGKQLKAVLNYTVITKDEEGKTVKEPKYAEIEIVKDGEVLLSKQNFTKALFAEFYGKPPTAAEEKLMSDIFGVPDSSSPDLTTAFSSERVSITSQPYNEVSLLGVEMQGAKLEPDFIIRNRKNWDKNK